MVLMWVQAFTESAGFSKPKLFQLHFSAPALCFYIDPYSECKDRPECELNVSEHSLSVKDVSDPMLF